MHNIIAIIPARGGSKGVKKKNIREINGVPLIAYTIRQARNSRLVKDVYVTTDSEEIAKVSKNEDARVVNRPDHLANDTATSESALIDALQRIKENEGFQPDLVVFLQCTSPIREKSDIDLAIERLQKENADSLLSVVDNHRFLWEIEGGKAQSINYDYWQRQRRQDLNPQYCENGSIYIFKPGNLIKYGNRLHGKIALHVMKPESAYEIDSHLDIHIVESVLNYLKFNKKFTHVY